MQRLMIDNPATLRRLGEVADSDAGAIEAAVTGARAALPQWQGLTRAQREQQLAAAGERIARAAEQLALLMSQEGGQPLCEARDCVQAVVALFRDSAAAQPAEAGGVLAVLLPFAMPLLFLAAAAAPALAAGSCVVAKAPAQNPLACLRLAELLDELPPGVVTVLSGSGATGMALARHAGVDRVDFTGTPAVGSVLLAALADKPVQLQTGSVDAGIVCADADLELAVPAVAWARLNCAGQAGSACRHLYVEQRIAAEFVDRLHQCVGFLDVDDPARPATDIGPLISLAAARRVEDQVGQVLRDGARLILGGRRFRPSGLPGHFFQPTILTDVPASSAATREQILGPVITVTPVEDAAVALDLAGRAVPGGGAALFAGDCARAQRLVHACALSAVSINDPQHAGAGPYSGLRHAGLQRALGGAAGGWPPARSVQVAASLLRKPWWFPYGGRARP